MKIILICVLVLASAELTGADMFDALMHKVPKGWTSYSTIRTEGLDLERGEYVSLVENKQVFKYTAMSNTFLTWFDQHFDFTSGKFYQVDAAGCHVYDFPPLNITEVTRDMFHNDFYYVGERGPDIHLAYMDLKINNQSAFFYYDAKRHRIDKVQSWDLSKNVPIESEFHTPHAPIRKEDHKQFDLPAECFNVEPTLRFELPTYPALMFGFNPENVGL